MATVAEVGVNLVARTGRFERGMLRATGTLRKFRGAALAAAGIGSGIAAARSFSQVGDQIDRIGKLSTRLGVTTEALSELRITAKLAGVDFETLAKGMADGARKMSEAAGGKGEAKDAFARLGLSAARLSKLAPEDQLLEVADAFQQLKDNSLGIELSQRIYGESGTQWLQFLKSGAEGIRANSDAAKELGATLSDESVRGVEKFHDRIAKAGSSVLGFFEKAYAGLAMFSNDAADGFKRFTSPSSNVMAGTFKFAEEVHKRNIATRQEEAKRKGIALELRSIYDGIQKSQAAAPTSTGTFGSVDLRRTGFGSNIGVTGGKPQLVKDPGIDTVVDVLRQILAKSGSARAA